MNFSKRHIVQKKKRLLYAFSLGLIYMNETIQAHAAVGDLLEGGANRIGSEAQSFLIGYSILAVIAVGVTFALGQKEFAKKILWCALGGFFLIRYYKEIGSFLNSIFP